MKNPPGSRPGISSLATIPTTRPNKIQPSTPNIPPSSRPASENATVRPSKLGRLLVRTRHGISFEDQLPDCLSSALCAIGGGLQPSRRVEMVVLLQLSGDLTGEKPG